ncbi:hypothetical protein [Marinobacterium weihaiense]|uniref:Uncharacterized protein n=1 Tax=Marinobacterium weihaiense TaxID=2851016 RepID=A0ABS6M9F2_9GAMM|nr:hypothetical protein [Marinobacterium weihaiense]MBV0932918.1 hypothetical protein [Marinobacterium weihaiense]
MKLNKLGILLLVLIPMLLIIGGTVSYFAYQKMQQQHQTNLAELEQFGYEMVPTDIYSKTMGELGAEQLPATFAEKKLTPTERVIRGLMRDKENLLAEQQALFDEIDALKQRIAELEDYKRLNKHFAPESFADELARIKSVLKSTLARMPESEPFSNIRLDVMAAAGTQEYERFVTANRLILDRAHKAKVVEELLPAYAFCVGNAVDLAANSRQEEHLLHNWFSQPDNNPLPRALADDLNTLLPACQLPLRKKLQASLPTTATGG